VVLWQFLTILALLPFVPLLVLIGKFPKFLGRIAKLKEGAGKWRIVAITDHWTQLVLKPLHDALFEHLKTVAQDGTFDQHKPARALHARIIESGAWSFDLSAATDRLPATFQRDILVHLLGWVPGYSWWMLLTFRPWGWKKGYIKYSVGQPMGAYSSWAMLAIAHHVLVQIAARRVGWTSWFPWYAVLGDDLLIADRDVALAYQALITGLGVSINMSKSVISESTYEFAKRVTNVLVGELSPLGPGAMLVTLRNPRYLPVLLTYALSKGLLLPFPERLRSAVSWISSIRRNSERLVLLTSLALFGPAGGMYQYSPAVGSMLLDIWLDMVSPKASRIVALRWILEYYLYKSHRENLRSATEQVRNLLSIIFRFWKYSLLGQGLVLGMISIPMLLMAPIGVFTYLSAYWSGVRRNKVILGHYAFGHTYVVVPPVLKSEHEIRNYLNRFLLPALTSLELDTSTIAFERRSDVLRLLADQEALLRQMAEWGSYRPEPRNYPFTRVLVRYEPKGAPEEG
jgi:hypothetical protein